MKKQTFADDDFLDRLMELVLAEGISNLTVGEMAARLRCSRRRLYDIAETKEEIFCAIVDRFFHGILEKGETLAREALIRNEQDLPAAIAAYLDVGVRAGGRMRVAFLDDVENSERARTSFDRYQESRTLRLTEMVDEGVRTGVFVPCHGRVVSEVILGAALRLRRPAFLAEAGLTIEEAFQEFYRMLLGGLLAYPLAARRAPRMGAIKPQKRGDGVRNGKRPRATNADIEKQLMAAWNRE